MNNITCNTYAASILKYEATTLTLHNIVSFCLTFGERYVLNNHGFTRFLFLSIFKILAFKIDIKTTNINNRRQYKLDLWYYFLAILMLTCIHRILSPFIIVFLNSRRDIQNVAVLDRAQRPNQGCVNLIVTCYTSTFVWCLCLLWSRQWPSYLIIFSRCGKILYRGR